MQTKILVDIREENIETSAIKKNDLVNITFYDKDFIVLKVVAEKSQLWQLAEQLLIATDEETTEELKETILKKENEIEELRCILDQYEENLEEYKEGLRNGYFPL